MGSGGRARCHAPARAESPLALAPVNGGAGVTAGITEATTASLLPEAFVKTLSGPLPEPDPVRLGALSAYRYEDVRPRGGNARYTLYAAPTSEGVVTVMAAPGDDADRVARSLALVDGEALDLGPDPVYAQSLGEIVVESNEQRAAARRKLRAATGPKSQHAAARQGAGVYDTAAKRVEQTSPPRLEAEQHQQLLEALKATEAAYTKLGQAARDSKREAYRNASSSVRKREQAVSAALVRLRDLGYVVA